MVCASLPTASLAFQRAGLEDVHALRTLAERIWRVSYAGLLSAGQIDYMLAMMYAPHVIAEEISAGVIWETALADGAVGFFSLTHEPAEARVKLNKLYVVPELQGAGLGQQILHRVHGLAASLAAGQVWLQVNKQNRRAIRAYERAGYGIARAAVFDIGGGYVMDDFIMTRSIATVHPGAD